MRRWNQSGQKYAGASDLAGLVLPSYPTLTWILVFITFGNLARSLLQDSLPSQGWSLRYFSRPMAMLLFTSSLSFKLLFTLDDSPEMLGQSAFAVAENIQSRPVLAVLASPLFAFLTISCLLPVAYYGLSTTEGSNRRARRLLPLALAALLIQTRLTNIPLLLIFEAITFLLRKLQLSRTDITLSTLLLSYASFFALGGTNSISSIDLSNAYNGISSFNVFAVGLLLFISNWAGPIYWAMQGTVLIIEQTQRSKQVSKGHAWAEHITLLTLFMAISSLGTMVACCMLRTHLFIWTVFSPKYLYMVAWLIGWHFMCNIVLGGFFILID